MIAMCWEGEIKSGPTSKLPSQAKSTVEAQLGQTKFEQEVKKENQIKHIVLQL